MKPNATRGPFYLWNGKGHCDNKTDSLTEARQWLIEFREQDGYPDAYLCDAADRVVSDDYRENT